MCVIGWASGATVAFTSVSCGVRTIPTTSYVNLNVHDEVVGIVQEQNWLSMGERPQDVGVLGHTRLSWREGGRWVRFGRMRLEMRQNV